MGHQIRENGNTQWPGAAAAGIAALACGVLLTLAACGSTENTMRSVDGADQGATAQCDLNSTTPPASVIVTDVPRGGTAAKDQTAGHALHNVHRFGAKMISGAVPEGPAAFDELRAMGVRTVISVDGAAPDVASAAERGMRYVHIPITYAEVTRDEQLEIARAVRDLPGPIYIHCHHGKHRSPAATAAVAVLIGEATPDEAVAFMKNAGTSAHYTGLYACVASAVAVSATAIDAAPAEFPSVRTPEGIVGAMVEVDLAYEQLGLIRAAGWSTPKDHPDLVPASEAGRLADHMRFSKDDPKTRTYRDVADFDVRLAAAVLSATELEERIIRGAAKPELEASWAKVVASCKDCHAVHRDHP